MGKESQSVGNFINQSLITPLFSLSDHQQYSQDARGGINVTDASALLHEAERKRELRVCYKQASNTTAKIEIQLFVMMDFYYTKNQKHFSRFFSPQMETKIF